MHELTALIKKDMLPALGVTEPGAIAFCAAKAKSYASGDLISLEVSMNSGMFKNAFTCGIPNSDKVGAVFAAALGYVAGNAEKGLEVLADVRPEDSITAEKLVDEGRVTARMSGLSSRIFIEAALKTTQDEVTVTIRDSHTNITKITVNGKTVFSAEAADAPSPGGEDSSKERLIHSYTLRQFVDYIETVSSEEISFVGEAYRTNLALFEEGLNNPRTTFAPLLLDMNGGEIISEDEKATASLLCNTAIEARVIGLDKPAMSITGSGAHGIIATMPLYGVWKIRQLPEDKLWRATMLSYLICTYIKEYSGKLSAFCGCAVAAGSGMACGLVWLWGGGVTEMQYALENMASSVTGMICDGGNQGCTMKGVAACDAAFSAARFAIHGVHVDNVHGINGRTPEETMRNIGLIASPGMVQTEGTIVEILESKLVSRP